MEQEIPFETFQPENRPTFIDFPLFQGIFQWEEPDETFFIYCRSEISVACENIRFSSLFAAEGRFARNVPSYEVRGETDAVAG